MFGNFLLKKLVASKLKEVPAEQRDKILKIIEEKPELFQKIALEAKAKMDQGKSQQDAMFDVIKNHEAELRDVMR